MREKHANFLDVLALSCPALSEFIKYVINFSGFLTPPPLSTNVYFFQTSFINAAFKIRRVRTPCVAIKIHYALLGISKLTSRQLLNFLALC